MGGGSEVDDEILRLETRHRVFRAVEQQPGIHLSEVAREARLLVTHARYNLEQLVRAELLTAVAEAGFVRYYARERQRGLTRDVLGRRDKELLSSLRRPRALQVALILAARGEPSLAAIAQALGRSRGTVSFHLERLVKRGVVLRLGETLTERRYALSNRAEVVSLLVRFPPRRSVVGSFIDLWDGLAVPTAASPTVSGGASDTVSADVARSGQVEPVRRGRLLGLRSMFRFLVPRRLSLLP